MSRYELTVDSNYVQDWGIPQAVREFFQNSIDGETEDPSNKSFFNYDEETQTLEIGNLKSVLNIESLLLGCTTKIDNESMVGQFGEGYKLATVVLLRNGKSVTFYNYGNKEVWNTKLIKSRRYNGRLVPVFDVDKKFVWQKVPHNNLVISIKEITTDEYNEIKKYILKLNDVGETLTDAFDLGTILLNEKYKGDVFVSGLLVCHNDSLHCGYDIPSKYMKLERDRHTVSDFDLFWHTSRIWSHFKDHPKFKEIFYSEEPTDVKYLYNWRVLDDGMLEQFYAKYGKDAIPVSTQEEFDTVKSYGGKPVIVTSLLRNTFDDIYTGFMRSTSSKTAMTCYDRLTKWMEDLTEQVDVPQDLYDEFQKILEIYEDDLT